MRANFPYHFSTRRNILHERRKHFVCTLCVHITGNRNPFIHPCPYGHVVHRNLVSLSSQTHILLLFGLKRGRLRGLTVACWITDHYHPCSNLGAAISERCFIFDFASLTLVVVRPIWPIMCTNVAVKHQSSCSSP